MSSVKFSKKSDAVARRVSAKKRLENQLLTGHKTVTLEDKSITAVKLTDTDVVRIQKEIAVLTSRI